jgi:alpha-D-ribose 1-methylphosphonate 5-triphosphate synthase subunit PhnI
MYVAVKGGEKAIRNAHRLLAHKRRGDAALPELRVAQIQEQMFLAVSRVLCEGALYDKELAALALKQAAGDQVEAIFLLRAYRATLPRFCVSAPLATDAMRIERRISATYKDIPGGQQLGATFDYTHRLIDFALLAEGDYPAPEETDPKADACPRVLALLAEENLLDRETASATATATTAKATAATPNATTTTTNATPATPNAPTPDITREPLAFPASRATRLQILARGDEGFLLALGYSTQRGYGRNHPFAGEIRVGRVDVWLEAEELDFPVPVGEIEISECEMVNQFIGGHETPPRFTCGYGLAFGDAERKAMVMALADRALAAGEYGEDADAPAQQEEFVLAHCDNVEAAGFITHLKLPHYVDFQSELSLIRALRREYIQSQLQTDAQADAQAQTPARAAEATPADAQETPLETCP